MTPPCILVTGGAGFIGGDFIHQWISAQKPTPSSIWTSSHTPGISTAWPEWNEPRHRSCRGILATRLVSSLLASVGPSESSTLRPKATSTGQSTARGFCRDECCGHVPASGGGPRVLDRLWSRKGRVSFPACLDGRSVWLAGQG